MELRRRVPKVKQAPLEKVTEALTSLDSFPKVERDYQQRSLSGAVLAVLTFSLMAGLMVSESLFWLHSSITYTYDVDTSTSPHTILNLDLTVATKCELVDADVYDHLSNSVLSQKSFTAMPAIFALDEEQARFQEAISRLQGFRANNSRRLEEIFYRDLQGMEERRKKFSMPVREIKTHEDRLRVDACRFHGSLVINRVAGVLHIISGKNIQIVGPGAGSMHAHLSSPTNAPTNFSHRIDHISFGPQKGHIGALDGEIKISDTWRMDYQYFVKVVPVSINTFAARADTYQISVTEKERVINHVAGSHGTPGIYINYDFTPTKIVAIETRPPFLQFLVRLTGIVGGVFSISSFLYFIITLILSRGGCEQTVTSRDVMTHVESRGGTCSNEQIAKLGNVSPGCYAIPAEVLTSATPSGSVEEGATDEDGFVEVFKSGED